MECFACLTTRSAAMVLNNYYLFYAPANDIIALFLILFVLFCLFWMLIDTMFARDMYQVYEINDDW